MTICEYCGRVHEATEIDRRFCSLVCRSQYENAPIFCPSESEQDEQDEQQRQGKVLRAYLTVLVKAAGDFRKQAEAEEFTPEQLLRNQQSWLAAIEENGKIVLNDATSFDISSLLPPSDEE